MLVDKNHKEPSNEKLGIVPMPKIIAWPAAAIVGGAMWYLLFLAIV